MYRIFIIAAVAAVSVARPELYKEQEDFKYSRSSSDEGSKSGYYGAQRGNMGGNYEKAHNMDSLAQNQMSGLVRQVEGELGDGANTRAGNVYSSANSRGTYGLGHYDLSNLAGRNFQEGASHGSSNSHASQIQSKSTFSNTGNTENYGVSRHGGYHSATADGHIQTDNLQTLDNTQTNNQFGYGRSSSHSSGYQSHSGFQKHSEYDSRNADSNSGSNVRTRLVGATTPVRIILTPTGRVAIPVAAQTYDASQRSSAFDHNSLNTEAKLSENSQGTNLPTSVKNYESSYSYKKKWEKHDALPTADIVVGRTSSPIPRNSELYEDSETRNQYNSGVETQSAHSNSASGRYSGVKSSSINSRHQSNYNTEQHSDSEISNTNLHGRARYHAGSNYDALTSSNNYHGQYGSRHQGVSSSSSDAASQTEHNTGSHSDLNGQVENVNLKPKSYQSSYSYHKSWERQGDPYTIYPATNGYSDSKSSQRLTSSSHSATHHSQISHGHDLEDCDCDENGHIRVARSYFTGNDEQQSQSNWDQQSQSNWDQQSQSNLDQQNVGQETQDMWEYLTQQSQSNWHQENGGQQIQDRWENLEDLNQQSQSTLDQQSNSQQAQSNREKIENLQQKIFIYLYNIGKNSSNFVGAHTQAFESELGIKSQIKFTEDQLRKSTQQNRNFSAPAKSQIRYTFKTYQVPNKRGTAYNWFLNSASNSSYNYSNVNFTKALPNNDQGINSRLRDRNRMERSMRHIDGSQTAQYAKPAWWDAVNITQTNNLKTTLQISPVVKFWNKFDNLEKSLGLSRQLQRWKTHSNLFSRNQNMLTSTYQPLQTPIHNDSIPHYNEPSQSKKQPDVRRTLPTFNQALIVVTVPSDSESVKLQGPEGRQDVGRGDISSENLMSEIDDGQVLHKTPSITFNKETHNEYSDQKTIENLNEHKAQAKQTLENNYEITQQNTYNSNKINEQVSQPGNIHEQKRLGESNNSYHQDTDHFMKTHKYNIQQENLQDSGKQQQTVFSEKTNETKIFSNKSQPSFSQQVKTRYNLEQQKSHFFREDLYLTHDNEELNTGDNTKDEAYNVQTYIDNDCVKYISAQDEHMEQVNDNDVSSQGRQLFEQIYGQQFLNPEKHEDSVLTSSLSTPEETNTESYTNKTQNTHGIVDNEPVQGQQKITTLVNKLKKRSIWNTLANKISDDKNILGSRHNYNDGNLGNYIS